MNKKFFVFMMILVAVAQHSMAQNEKEDAPLEEKKGFDKSKLFIGGTFGLSFSSYYTLVNLSPQLGYRFNKYLAAGAGFNFTYSSQKNYYSNGADYSKIDYGVVGVNIFGRVYPIHQILLQLQPEMNYTWGKEKYYDGSPAYTINGKIIPSLLAGAGGALPMGNAGSFIIMVQYDLLQDIRSPYGSRAFFSFGYSVGF